MNALLDAGTAVIADVFDSLGLPPPALANSIAPLAAGASFIGPAYTIAGRAEAIGQTGDRNKLAAIDGIPAGAVAIWGGGDIRGACCFGDLLSEAMVARGCTGVVVDGGIRDSAYLGSLSMPIFARYRTPVQGVGRWSVTTIQEPIQVRGAIADWITIEPGDVVAADADGVIVVPQALVEKVTAQVIEWSAVESESREAIKNGMPLLTAIETFGHL
jgi:regulator of RNase E activity RraA